MSLKKRRSSQLMGESHFSSLVEPSTGSVEASSARTSIEDTRALSTQATTAQSNDSAIHQIQRELLGRDTLIASLRAELSAIKAQEVGSHCLLC